MGGLKLQGSGNSGESSAPASEPPPIPIAPPPSPGPSPVAAVAPVAISYGFTKQPNRINPDEAPDPIEIGWFARTCIWALALILFVGSYGVWHLMTELGESMWVAALAVDSGDMEFGEDTEFALGFIDEAYGLGEFGDDWSSQAVSSLPSHWPDLRLSGVFKGNARAPDGIIIDGSLVSVGGMALGVKVQAIRGYQAQLSYQGETLWIETGGAGIGGISARKVAQR